MIFAYLKKTALNAVFFILHKPWDLLGLENIDEVSNLPSVQWKLMNLNNMDIVKHTKALDKLKTILYPVKEDKLTDI